MKTQTRKYQDAFGLVLTRNTNGCYRVSLKGHIIGSIQRDPSYGWIDCATKKWLGNTRDMAAGAMHAGHNGKLG